MLLSEKTQVGAAAFWVAMVLLFAVLGRYGRQAVEWLLLKLYELFIQTTPTKI